MEALGTPRSESQRSPFRTNTPPELPVVGPDGTLNLANRKLSKLYEKHKDTFATVKRLNLANNSFKQLDSLIWFKECEEVDASHNDLVRLRCFATISKTLTVLDVSSNRLASLDCLDSLRQLKCLIASHNRIEFVHALDHLPHLEELDLGSNHLKALPDLHKLSALRTLNLHANEITSLEGIAEKFPRELRHLDLGDNLIEDLCELHYLSPFYDLESIGVMNNPCVKGEGRKFSYRPFVYSCILGQLLAVDDTDLSEQEMIKGEWLHTAGKTRAFQPKTNSHNELCEYLARECPRELGEHQLENSFTEKLRKVVEKRREYISSSHDESSLSLSLPKSVQRESPKISPARNTARTPTSRVPLRMLAEANAKQPRGILESSSSDGEADRSTASDVTSITVVISKADSEQTPDNVLTNAAGDGGGAVSPSSSSTTVVPELVEDAVKLLETPRKGLQRRRPYSDPVLSLHAGQISDAPERPHSGGQVSRVTVAQRLIAGLSRPVEASAAHMQIPTHAVEPTRVQYDIFEPNEDKKGTSVVAAHHLESQHCHEAATKLQAWWRGVVERKRHASRVIAMLRSQVSALRSKVDELTLQTALLTNINEEQMRFASEWNSMLARLTADKTSKESKLAKRVEELENTVAALVHHQALAIPTPTNLSFVRRSDSQALISWENAMPLASMIQGYELFLNGESCGQIVAPGQKAIVDMINPEEDLTVAVQAISSLASDLRSAAAEVVIPKVTTENKENIDAAPPAKPK